MKTTCWTLAIVAVGLLAFAGCKRAEQPAAPAIEYNGVKVDWPKLDTAFANASPEVLAAVSKVRHPFRYGQLPEALAELLALAWPEELLTST